MSARERCGKWVTRGREARGLPRVCPRNKKASRRLPGQRGGANAVTELAQISDAAPSSGNVRSLMLAGFDRRQTCGGRPVAGEWLLAQLSAHHVGRMTESQWLDDSRRVGEGRSAPVRAFQHLHQRLCAGAVIEQKCLIDDHAGRDTRCSKRSMSLKRRWLISCRK